MRSQAERFAKLHQPNLMQVYETVSIPEYRFVVTEVARGKRMDERVPEHTRISPQDAEHIVSQIALALQPIHQEGGYHGQVRPELIRLGKGSQVQLAFPSYFQKPPSSVGKTATTQADPALQQNQDLKDLAKIWYRLASGNWPDQNRNSHSHIARRLERYAMATPSVMLISGLLRDDEAHRPSLESLLNVLHPNGDRNGLDSHRDQPATLAPFESWLARSPADFRLDGPPPVSNVELLPHPISESAPPAETVPANDWQSIQAHVADERTSKTTAINWRLIANLALGSLLAVASLLSDCCCDDHESSQFGNRGIGDGRTEDGCIDAIGRIHCQGRTGTDRSGGQ